MKNPFEYGGVVSGNAFCNRQQELVDLRRATENGEKLFVFSERRYGKTSLVRAALSTISADRFIVVKLLTVCLTINRDLGQSYRWPHCRLITENMAGSRRISSRRVLSLSADHRHSPMGVRR